MLSFWRNIFSLVGILAMVMMVAASGDNGKGEAHVCDDSDPTYVFVGGRHICKRECRSGEVGPTGNICVDTTDVGTGEPICDCGV
ncbi:MAG: hypothetical protein GY952_05810 [Rhodobacteraceae bacterium]|nr:hypothetical protein [Paracoccaceae bacterium]